MADAFDPRFTPARPDVAAAHLKGKVEALRFVEGDRRRVAVGHAGIRKAPGPDAMLDTEALYGEEIVVFDELEGWAWAQGSVDSYVGYLPSAALSAELGTGATHRVAALRTLLFPTVSIKAPPVDALSMNALVSVTEIEGKFARLDDGAYAIAAHLRPVGDFETDPVGVAERFVGAPYLWGGRTSLGLDCSALVQVSLAACGVAAPRDSDMQEKALGREIALDQAKRGDLMFWKGHVGLVRGADSLIHANAHAMAVAIEPLGAAIERIRTAGDEVSAVKRLD